MSISLAKQMPLILLAVVSLSACAGRNFVRPAPGSIEVGKTTGRQIRDMYGAPFRSGTATTNGVMVETASYAFASGAGSLAGGVTPARSLGFYYRDDVVVGYEFTSSFSEDSTDFDSSRVKSIEMGRTSGDEVVEIFGPPGGEYIFPMIESLDDRAIVYLYSETRGSSFNLSFSQKHLVVTLARDGTVVDVKFVEAGPQ